VGRYQISLLSRCDLGHTVESFLKTSQKTASAFCALPDLFNKSTVQSLPFAPTDDVLPSEDMVDSRSTHTVHRGDNR